MDEIVYPTAEEIAAYEALDETEKLLHAKPAPKIKVLLDLEELDLISDALEASGVLGVAQTIDAHWVALTVLTQPSPSPTP